MRGQRDDTIAALATAPGNGAVAIVRLSGPAARAIGSALTGVDARPRYAEVCTFRSASGEPVDRGLVLFFPAPRSYTGEDVVELHGHGGRVVSDALLAHAYALGARPAEPGEFTLRAFLNDKLDLLQAEAVADLVASGSSAAARAALRSLDGAFSARVAAIQEALTRLRVKLEAWLDFPDEELRFDAGAESAAAIDALLEDVAALAREARSGAVLRDGLSVAIAGPPNAGKSSLLNRLAGYDAAIVTDIPGTTRDPLREHLTLDGLPVTIVDTAGLRESADPVEREGLRRARVEVRRANRVLWVVDVREPLGAGRARHLRADRRGHRRADRASAGARGLRRRRARHVQRAAPAPRGARTRACAARRGARAARRRARARGRGAPRRAGRARRAHGRAHERRLARRDLRDVLYRQVARERAFRSLVPDPDDLRALDSARRRRRDLDAVAAELLREVHRALGAREQ